MRAMPGACATPIVLPDDERAELVRRALVARAPAPRSLARPTGRSHDAFVEGVTGVAPADESAGTLARVLGELLSDPHRLEEMGRQAGEWARNSFAPDVYASRAVAKLL